jgi:hypothetical protein
MANLLMNFYFGVRVWSERKKNYKRRPGLLSHDSMKAGARALRAAFWRHIVDKEVVSAAMTIKYNKIPFADYMKYAMHREAFLKVAATHRNLLPVLPHINPEQWGRADLFSRKLWVRDGRLYTALDRQAFHWSTGHRSFNSFDRPASWRWLSKSSPLIVKAWLARDSTTRDIILTNLALVDINVRAPVIAYTHILHSSSRLADHGVSPRTQKLLSLFLMHCAAIWENEGFVKVKAWLKSDGGSANFGLMLDYLEAEGYAQGQPSKNATWASLARRSDDWHRRIAIENMERELKDQKLLKWNALVPETVIDGVVFRPLINSRDLAVEGYELKHCAGRYRDRCHHGNYRVYSCLESDGTRSTLGISIYEGKASWDQHLGKYNCAVSSAAHEAGKKLAGLYQQALNESKEHTLKKDKAS